MEIAREAGLGSYGVDPDEQALREESVLRALEDAEQEATLNRPTRGLVLVLCVVVVVLASAVAYLLVTR
jgi:hypothetical protein